MHSHREIVRKSLLSAVIKGQKNVARVEVREIELAAGQETGLHLHPCPVVGTIIQGSIRFQIAGHAEKILRTGDAFFEPAHTRIAHFDATAGDPAKFVACYLLGEGGDEDEDEDEDEDTLIEML